ncbi:hydrogen gas-evolving membrane-bound hydrogenase subunit E [Chelatococcus reniformis]|uniref:Sodium:proton antiporter n=1 Tax=Chelatococcus reniformis TaxID=1494448 RepID=A0A916UEV9_9HYPH|nr:hydrogen gas-evolving membrane-bound hydrogenase subunit E [Chelatococcus reniformis]GGC69756.1 hypothetical protein GCM10010994_30390 [Chelatococcus reniformis]
MTRHVIVALVVALFGLVFVRLVGGYAELSALRPLAAQYVTQAPLELGTPNIVTGILITFRGFDTLGEVAVLFMVAASIGLLLKKDEPNAASEAAAAGIGEHTADDAPLREPSEIVRTGTDVLLPLIFVFGAYVIVNGHLSAGGGFQGGAIVASGAMLMLLARPGSRLSVALLSVIESFAGVLYVSLGLVGLVFAAGFLDPRFLPKGEFGAFVSAGAIPLISALLGIKVGAELSVIIDRFRG